MGVLLRPSAVGAALQHAPELNLLQEECSAISRLAALHPSHTALYPVFQPICAGLDALYARPYLPPSTAQRVLTLIQAVLAACMTPGTEPHGVLEGVISDGAAQDCTQKVCVA